MLLTDLPHDILITLPSYLHSFQDLSSILLTCRSLYLACSSLTPAQLKRLTETPNNGLHPQPHLFIAIKARKLADWAVEKAHPDRRETLSHAIMAGPEMLLRLALRVDPLSLSDHLRASWVKRVILDPITKELDLECGKELREGWRRHAADAGSEYYQRYFRRKEAGYVESSDEGDDEKYHEAFTMLSVCEDVGLAILNFWIYCDLFHHTIVPPVVFSPETAGRVEPLSDALRLDWFHYCVPDNNDKFVEPEGEFQQFDLRQFLPSFCPKLHQVLTKDGRGFETGSRKQIWFYNIARHMGLASLRLLVPMEGGERFPNEIQRIKGLMEDLDVPEGKFNGIFINDCGEEQELDLCGSSEGGSRDGDEVGDSDGDNGGDRDENGQGDNSTRENEGEGEGEDEDEDISWVSLAYDIKICFQWT